MKQQCETSFKLEPIIGMVLGGLVLVFGGYIVARPFMPYHPPETEVTFTVAGSDVNNFHLCSSSAKDYAIEDLEHHYDACEAKLPAKDREGRNKTITSHGFTYYFYPMATTTGTVTTGTITTQP